jgi:hypothetical protein
MPVACERGPLTLSARHRNGPVSSLKQRGLDPGSARSADLEAHQPVRCRSESGAAAGTGRAGGVKKKGPKPEGPGP